MAAKHGSRTLLPGSGSLVDGLAKTVISQVNTAPHHRRSRRIEIGSKILYAAVLDTKSFDQELLKSDLSVMRITLTDIVDHCIPQVAIELGQGWVDDTLSFAEVTVASARLFGLCKSIGQQWDNIRPHLNSLNLLLATAVREDHILGPAVLADQLRRRGHSVRLQSNATAETIVERLYDNHYDGILMSVASGQSLESASKIIRDVKLQFPNITVVLGGATLTGTDELHGTTGADLVTNDIDKALDAMAADDISLRVAE